MKFMKRLVLLGSTFFLLSPASVMVASAQVIDADLCSGSAASSAVCQDRNNSETDASNSFYGRNGILTKAASLVALVVGIASVIMIIVGGFKYALANGDSNSINSAKNTILYALVGLVISVLAGSIIRFVLSRL